ncbi:MAG: toll/interleukin-1 receptor domain-containing protein, partial [Blastocatellia bacterium]
MQPVNEVSNIAEAMNDQLPPETTNQPKAFISYARDDMNRALGLEQALRAHGVNVWRDQDSIYGGQQWPKVIGEAIADCDAVLLLWSANSAASHFVEFEWTTALALKKTIIPCLLDEARLPPALAAINGIACRNADEAAPKILAALPRESQPREAERRAQVIAQLQLVTATEPAAALAQVRALFTQSNINVGGHFIQGGGDVQVTINEGRQHLPIFAIAFAVIAIVALAAFYFISGAGQLSPQPLPSPTVEEMTYLRGQVDDADGNP